MLFYVPDKYKNLFDRILATLSFDEIKRAAIAVVIIPNNDFREVTTIYHDCDQTDKQMCAAKIQEDFLYSILNDRLAEEAMERDMELEREKAECDDEWSEEYD